MLKHITSETLYFKSGKYEEAIAEFQQVLGSAGAQGCDESDPHHRGCPAQGNTEQQQLEIRGQVVAHFSLAESYYNERF